MPIFDSTQYDDGPDRYYEAIRKSHEERRQQEWEAARAHESALSQSEKPTPETPAGKVIYDKEITPAQLEYIRRGYAIAEYGILTPPEYFKKEGEERLKNRMGLPYDMTNQRKMAEWHKRQLALLELAKEAPRCEHVFIDGTTCQSPRMRGHKYCYAHEGMLEVRPKKLKLLPAEDENSIMWNIMEIQRALIDDEITEKKAGLLLYGQQLQLIAVRGVTFRGTDPGSMVRQMPKTVSRELTRMNTKEGLAADERRGTQDIAGIAEIARNRRNLKTEESLPRIDAEKAGSEKNHTTDDTDGTDQKQESKTEEPQRAQRNAKEHRQECRCHTSQSIPGDESDKSLLSGDEGMGPGGVERESIPSRRRPA